MIPREVIGSDLKVTTFSSGGILNGLQSRSNSRGGRVAYRSGQAVGAPALDLHMLRNARTDYGIISRALHQFIELCVVRLVWLGWWMVISVTSTAGAIARFPFTVLWELWLLA